MPCSILPLFIFAASILVAGTSAAAESGNCSSSGPLGSTITNFDHVDYLERFGYTGYARPHLPVAAPNEEIKTLAIQTFQTNFGLTETGELNDETLFKMLIPRCGVTDITDGINAMRLGNSPKTANSSSTVPKLYDFLEGLPKWNYFNLSYVFMSNFPEEAKDDIRAALDKFTFYEVGYPFDGPRNVLAHAFPPSDEYWSFEPRTTDYYHIETVALHEIGHLLGLGHTLVEEAIMYPSITLHQFKDLAEDDVDGINYLYQPL